MVGSVFPQIARLHHFSPFSLPSSVAHIDSQATRSGLLTCSAAPCNSLLMYQINVAQGRLLMGIQLKQFCLDGEACKRQQLHCREDQ